MLVGICGKDLDACAHQLSRRMRALPAASYEHLAACADCPALPANFSTHTAHNSAYTAHAANFPGPPRSSRVSTSCSPGELPGAGCEVLGAGGELTGAFGNLLGAYRVLLGACGDLVGNGERLGADSAHAAILRAHVTNFSAEAVLVGICDKDLDACAHQLSRRMRFPAHSAIISAPEKILVAPAHCSVQAANF